MTRTIIALTALWIAAGTLAAAEDRTPFKLPEQVAAPGYLDRIASPQKDRELFYLSQPGQPGTFGVASPDGVIEWQRNAGIRPINSYVWAADGRSVVYVTDCSQAAADLRSPSPEIRNYFFVLDSAKGTVQAKGDLDLDILDLPKQLPGAVGAAHVIDELSLVEGVLHATISHRKTKVSGSRALVEISRHER